MRNFILTFLTIMVFIPAAFAADKTESQIFVPPGSGNLNNAEEIMRTLKEQSLEKAQKIEVKTAEVSLVHHHYMEPDQFGIMLKVPNVVSGCFDISPMEYEVNFVNETYMDIEVKAFRRKPVKTQNVAYDCDQQTKAITGLIVLNAKDLEKRGVKEIRFSNGNVRDVYNVVYQPDSIVLKPESMIAFKANLTGPEKDKLVHYYSGQTLVALHVPMAHPDDNIAQRVRNLAYKNALTPVFEKEGLDTSGKDNVFYFMDPHGRALDLLNDDGYAEFGTVQVVRPYDGPSGRTGVAVPLQVFVTRPGTTL
jgi:hypothetical protein